MPKIIPPGHFDIETLGKATITSPLDLIMGDAYTHDRERIAYDPHLSAFEECRKSKTLPVSFEIAGPRAQLFFDPRSVRAAIVTCGGLCPGLNAVIRALVMQLWHRYGCQQIRGIRYGYHGLSPSPDEAPIELTPDIVKFIHMQGGTILASSRGSPSTSAIVDTLAREKIDMLFTIGGDGTMRGALAIWDEIKARNLKIAVVGIPKTIDNDIPYVRRSFGFETAVSYACEALHAASVEAEGAQNGIGLVKLMGRQSGYIAANATLATGQVNFCLIPEVPFALEGTTGLVELIATRLRTRKNAVVVVAEAAGQEFFAGSTETDASGNVKLGDIGLYLKQQIVSQLKTMGVKAALRYIDPSYIIRGQAANAADQLFCGRLAQDAVHAAMAGKTGMLVGYWHGRITHVPMRAIGNDRQSINPHGELWFNVLETTGQPRVIG